MPIRSAAPASSMGSWNDFSSPTTGDGPMMLPDEALPLLAALAPHFTRPTARRFAILLTAAILTQGRRTVANLLRSLGTLAPGHRTDYQRVLSRAPWSGLRLGCALAGFILAHLVPDGLVTLVGDDTVDGHPGRRVYGKARHRDPVRSSHAFTAWKYGHRWVVLAVLVRFPFAARPWALPVLVDLYRSEEDDRLRGRPHRTPAQLMCRLLPRPTGDPGGRKRPRPRQGGGHGAGPRRPAAGPPRPDPSPGRGADGLPSPPGPGTSPPRPAQTKAVEALIARGQAVEFVANKVPPTQGAITVARAEAIYNSKPNQEASTKNGETTRNARSRTLLAITKLLSKGQHEEYLGMLGAPFDLGRLRTGPPGR